MNKNRNLGRAHDKAEGSEYENEIEEFLYYMRTIKGLSEKTLESYRRDISDFLVFTKKDPGRINQTDIMRFLSSLQREGMKSSTVSRKLSSIRTFIFYLLNSGRIGADPSIGLKLEREERSLPDTLTVKEVDALLDAPDTSEDTGTRDKAILELLYGTGLKAGEAAGLNLSDLNLKSGYLVKRERNGAEKFIPLNRKALRAVEEYVKYVRYTQKGEKTDAVFLNKFGKRLSRQSIWKMIKSYSRKVGINKNVSPAVLRHSFAVHMLENGVNIETVKEILGHQSISTTQIYREKKQESLSDALRRAHPRG